MILTIELPPVNKKLDVNHGVFHRLGRSGAVKQARSVGKRMALEAMSRQGVRRGEYRPRFAWLVTYWYQYRVDYDNRLANVKAYQDGVFEALGVDDREVCTGVSSVYHLPKAQRQRHLTMQLMLFETLEEFLLNMRTCARFLSNGEGYGCLEAKGAEVCNDEFLPGFAGGIVGTEIRRSDG